MKDIAVWGFSWVPPFAQGLVRDLRVRWALEEAGLPYESKWINADERTSEGYRRKHPFGVVPVIESDGQTMIESGAIIHAIAEQHEVLMPPDRRTETLAWMFAALNTVEPPLWNLFVIDQLQNDQAWTKLRRPGAVDEANARLAALSAWLEGREYLLESFTAADILMATTLRFLRHTNLVTEFLPLDKYLKRCEARPAFQAALRNQAAVYAHNTPVAA
ncbi:MAG TPA: glutathione S-transferase family protein [Paraburkholderia sp.]|uniref:glutathione S-transferase family protein n=1 Tax=Paraburkholderia sp. TaxID=1926495 RepID=UPI002B463BCA|nr:glutathione S-transferase family protein [Paraburkholderia sp.]HKR42416.1 glutathione S-transferase family protein [Paraburkholderia sp.]